MVEYYIIKHMGGNKKMMLEGIDGRVVHYDPIYRNLVLGARKKENMAIRLPTDIKNNKLKGLVPIELFNEARKKYNETEGI
jgi:hypothetical protein